MVHKTLSNIKRKLSSWLENLQQSNDLKLGVLQLFDNTFVVDCSGVTGIVVQVMHGRIPHRVVAGRGTAAMHGHGRHFRMVQAHHGAAQVRRS